MEQEISDAEVTQMIRDAIVEMNVEMAAHCEPTRSLTEILGFQQITHLRRLGRILHVKYYGKRDRQELIAEIAGQLGQTEVLRRFLDALDEDSWRFFSRLADLGEIRDNQIYAGRYMSSQKLGLLQPFYFKNQIIFVIPAEISEAYGQLAAAGYAASKEIAIEQLNFSTAAVHLYGVIGLQDLADLYNRHHENPVDWQEMASLLSWHVNSKDGFCFWQDYLVDSVFSENGFADVKPLLNERERKPRYEPAFAEFMHYADWDYYELTPQLEALRRHLAQWIEDPDELTDLLDNLHDLFEQEVMPGECFDLLRDAGIEFDDMDALKLTLSLIVDVQNHTRLWRNYGHTPSELSRRGSARILPFPADRSGRAVKVGRNDPCPCGSGKKYKNCCGK